MKFSSKIKLEYWTQVFNKPTTFLLFLIKIKKKLINTDNIPAISNQEAEITKTTNLQQG